MSTTSQRKTERIEVRVTPDDKELVTRAVGELGTDLSAFVTESVVIEAQRVLADRTDFRLSPSAWEAWEALNARPARRLEGLAELLERPSPFVD